MKWDSVMPSDARPEIEITPDQLFDKISPDVDVQRVRDLTQLLSDILFQAADHRRVYELKPFSPSQAFREPRDGREKFGEHQVLTAFSIPWTLIVSAEDHLASLRLVIQRSSYYSPRVLTRSIVEASARAWWHFDSAITVQERIRRSFNAQLDSARELLRLETENRHDLNASERLERLVKEAEESGFEVSRNKGGNPLWIDQKPEGSGKLINELLSEHVEGIGLLMWRHLSAVTHGTMYAVLSTLQPGEHPFDKESQGGTASTKTTDIDQAVTISLLAYLPAFRRMVQLYGWDVGVWRDLEHRAWVILFPQAAAKAARTRRSPGNP